MTSPRRSLAESNTTARSGRFQISIRFQQQSQQIFPTIDLNVSPNWEFNFGAGVDVSNSADHLIIKCIVGRRFTWGHKVSAAQP